jgi:small subunit ribosomal protein S6
MSRRYEIVYIFDSALEEAQVNERLERFHALLKSADRPEAVTSLTHWGKRTLAYPIKSKEVGYYVVAQLEADPTLLPEFERALKLDEDLIRHLVILNEGEAPRPVRVSSPDDDDVGSDNEEAD